MRQSIHLALSAILTIAALAALVWNISRLDRMDGLTAKSELSLAYSCGFRDGQIDTMNRMPAYFRHEDFAAGSCPAFRANAAVHGFPVSDLKGI